MEPKTTKNKIDFLPHISDEDSSFKKDLSFLKALFLLLTLIGFAVVYESLFYLSNRKLQKQTIKEVLLAE